MLIYVIFLSFAIYRYIISGLSYCLSLFVYVIQSDYFHYFSVCLLSQFLFLFVKSKLTLFFLSENAVDLGKTRLINLEMDC